MSLRPIVPCPFANWQPGRQIFASVALIISLLATFRPAAAQGGDPVVLMQTTKGTIVMRIYTGMAPNTAASFLDLVSRGFYNGLTFHRVENWVIQGGDPSGTGNGVFVDPQSGQPRYLQLEASRYLRHNAPGVVAMAHGKSLNSSSCQFYITKKAMPALDGSYSIFGGVLQGMDVVYNIARGDRILQAEIANTGGAGRQSSRGSNQPPPAGDSGF